MSRCSGGGGESGESHLVDGQTRETFIAGFGFVIAEKSAASVAAGYKREFGEEEGEERRGSGK
jgi:hypothetical protein